MRKYLYARNYVSKWLVVATLMGLGGGVSAVILSFAIDRVQTMMNVLPLLVAPAIGGAFVMLIYLMEPQAKGFGTDIYMDYANRRSTILPVRLWLFKMLSTIGSIGTYGSGGVEGPMLVIGGSIASAIKKIKVIRQHFTEDERRTVAICGAAGAIGAIFKSPLGGGVFVVEILYRSSLHYADLFPAMLSSTMGYVIYSMITGDKTFFTLPEYIPNLFNIPLFIAAAVAAGIASLLFMRVFKLMGDWFHKLPYKRLHPVLGGVLTGVVIFALPSVAGTGTGVIQGMIEGSVAPLLLLGLLFGKMVATAFTVQSGGSAGLVIPALFVGAASAGLLSILFSGGHSGLTASMVVAGMASALSGIANVPVAASIMLIEMVGLSSAIPAVLGSVIGYSINHSKVIYDVDSPDHLKGTDMFEWRFSDCKTDCH